jgi:hypothetical protein
MGHVGVDLGLFVGFYIVTGLGITVGFHRLFTHQSFKAPTPVRVAFAIAGSMAIQGRSSTGWRPTAATTPTRTVWVTPIRRTSTLPVAPSACCGACGTPTSVGCSLPMVTVQQAWAPDLLK